MNKKTLATVFCVFLLFSVLGTNIKEHEETEVAQEAETQVVMTREDSIKQKNQLLFEAFFHSLAMKESRLTSKVISTNNKGGVTSYGYVQITPIFVKQANLNRWMHENGITKRTCPTDWHQRMTRYYTLKDAYSWDKSKEMVYWVNKEHFDKYDHNLLTYDEALWRKVINTHNSGAKASYRNDILSTYRVKVKKMNDIED